MSRSEFRAVVAEIVKSISKDEFDKLKDSPDFFAYIHPQIIEKFGDDFNELKGKKTWSNFLREIRFWEDLGIPYMYKRIMQLCLRFTKKHKEFFRINSEMGSFTLPTRLDKLLKIALLANEFVYEIIPKIENHINFKSDSVIKSAETIRGKIDWNKTILSSLNRGQEHPSQFTCIINQTNFETEENVLALISLLKLQTDVESLLLIRSKEVEYSKKEIRTLTELKIQIDNLVSHTHMKDMVMKYEKYRYLTLNSKIIQDLEVKTHKRIQQGIVKQTAYSDLLEWIKKYRGHHIESITRDYADFPIQHERSMDTMYELWIIFEMLNYFIENKGVKMISDLEKIDGSFAGFELEIDNERVLLNFQDERVGWTSEVSKPDFTIGIDNEIPIIMDPKNYSTSQTGDAIHKMLGYVFNLGKFNATTGILFFPRPIPRHKIDEKNYHPFVESKETLHGKDFSLTTLIANPTRPDELKGNLAIIFDHIHDVILNKIKPKT